MNKKKKGQSAIELIIIFGVVLLFFVLFFTVIEMNQSEKNKENRDLLLQNVALDVRDEINIAAGASEGYSRNFTIPEKVYGMDYNIIITDTGDVYLYSQDYAVSFKASNVTGTVKKGTNTIRKENGEVYLN